MAADNFWNNRDQAQKLIEEANSLRGKIEPLLKADKELEDFRVMVELGEAEPEAAQAKIQQEIEADLARFYKALDALELKVKMDEKQDFVLVDVREQNEYDIAHIKGSVLIPLSQIAPFGERWQEQSMVTFELQFRAA